MRVAVAARTAQQLNDTLALLPQGTQAIAIPADVTSEADVRNMVSTTEAQLGPVDVLINCAGMGRPFGPSWEADAQEWWRNIEVNLKGPMLCCHTVVRGMIGRRRGRIINVASGAGTMSIPFMSAYVSAKAALIRFTEVLADELRGRGVAVFAIQPGTVRTALAEELMNSQEGERWLLWFKQIFDEKRDDSPETADELVLYLASGKADALSGCFLAAPGAPGNLEGQTDRILKNKLNVLRLRS